MEATALETAQIAVLKMNDIVVCRNPFHVHMFVITLPG